MMKHNHRKTIRIAVRITIILFVVLFVAAAFLIEYRGGTANIPTWNQLYKKFGIALDSPDSTLLSSESTTITALDVGQGDAVLIGQDGQYCLIDTGPYEAQDALVHDLQAAGVTELTYLVLTHPHADHAGGAKAVLSNFTVQYLLLPQWQPTSAEDSANWPRGMESLAESRGTVIQQPADGTVYPLGCGTLTVLQSGGGTAEDVEDPSAEINNVSLCTMFAAGDFRYLSTGDAEAEAEQRLVDRYGSALQATLLKAGHHGSYTSTGEALLLASKPQAVLISCGLNNDYGHPHAKTLSRLDAAGCGIWRTDLCGTITFTYNNSTLDAVISDEMDAAA